jgi:hypothetical protein
LYGRHYEKDLRKIGLFKTIDFDYDSDGEMVVIMNARFSCSLAEAVGQTEFDHSCLDSEVFACQRVIVAIGSDADDSIVSLLLLNKDHLSQPQVPNTILHAESRHVFPVCGRFKYTHSMDKDTVPSKKEFVCLFCRLLDALQTPGQVCDLEICPVEQTTFNCQSTGLPFTSLSDRTVGLIISFIVSSSGFSFVLSNAMNLSTENNLNN